MIALPVTELAAGAAQAPRADPRGNERALDAASRLAPAHRWDQALGTEGLAALVAAALGALVPVLDAHAEAGTARAPCRSRVPLPVA